MDVHFPNRLKRHGAVRVVADGAPRQPRRVRAEDGQVKTHLGQRLQHALRPPTLTGCIEEEDPKRRWLPALTKDSIISKPKLMDVLYDYDQTFKVLRGLFVPADALEHALAGVSPVQEEHGVLREAQRLGPSGPRAEAEAQGLLHLEVEGRAGLPLGVPILVLNELPAEL